MRGCAGDYVAWCGDSGGDQGRERRKCSHWALTHSGHGSPASAVEALGGMPGPSIRLQPCHQSSSLNSDWSRWWQPLTLLDANRPVAFVECAQAAMNSGVSRLPAKPEKCTKRDKNPATSGTQPLLAVPHAHRRPPNEFASARGRAIGLQTQTLQPASP